MYQKPIPEKYKAMPAGEVLDLIGRRKREIGPRMIILGHHYQRDEIIQFADYTGDSLELSRIAAREQAPFIVFCGVHFMAESADILARAGQTVLLPDLSAGCSMADMADLDQVEAAWAWLTANRPAGKKLVPVTYVNSSAAIKAFCGRRGGLCCTSSNCRQVLESIWGADPGAAVLFMPDEHLGRNTAYKMGVSLAEMSLWDPYAPAGGLTPEQARASRIVLWKGFCSVHQEFTAKQIVAVRKADPQVRVIVHPECPFSVVQAADESGSTAHIIKVIRAAAPGSHWAVGTEINLVSRLAAEMAPRGVQVESLSTTHCQCETMYRIDPAHLAWLLDALAAHLAQPAAAELTNVVRVEQKIKKDARQALEKMLNITAPKS